MSFLDNVQMEDLPEEQFAIAEVIGIDNYLNLVRTFGGNPVRILQEKTLIQVLRNEQICKEYTGKNIRQLAQKYVLSDRSIRNIIHQRGFKVEGNRNGR